MQGRLQAGKICRRTLGGGHQHDVTGVGILALHTPLPQSLCQLLTGKTQRGGVQRQLEGFTVRPGEGECQPGPEGIQLPAEHPQPPAADVQLLPEAVGQNRVGGVQRLQNEIRGAGGAEESQRIAHRGLVGLHGRPKVQIGTAREDGQGLVSRVTAKVRAQLDGVAATLLQKVEIGAVSVVHQKGQAVGVADRRQPRDILHEAQIIRAGEVDAEGRTALGGQLVQRRGKSFRFHRAGAERPGGVRRGPEPLDVEVQQSRRVKQGFVGVPRRQQDRTACLCGPHLERKAEHSPDALAAALGAVIGAGGAKELRRVGLALGDDALGFVQLVCARNFGDVKLFTAQRAAALVARHMHPGSALLGVATDKIDDRSVHGFIRRLRRLRRRCRCRPAR